MWFPLLFNFLLISAFYVQIIFIISVILPKHLVIEAFHPDQLAHSPDEILAWLKGFLDSYSIFIQFMKNKREKDKLAGSFQKK